MVYDQSLSYVQLFATPWTAYEAGDVVQSLGREYPLEKEMATHSNVLAWRIPGTGEPGGLPSMGSHREIGRAHV